MKTSLKNNKVINDTIDMKTVMIKDSLIIVFAFLSLLGKTIATGYVKAAIGIIILVSAVKVPKTPNASGPYNLVIIRDNNKDKACDTTSPESKTIATGYIKAAIGIILLLSAVILPKTPAASGPYNLVIIGDKNKDKACAPTAPDATINTFRTNFFLKSFLI